MSATKTTRFPQSGLGRRLLSVRGKHEAYFLFSVLLLCEWVMPGPASLAQIQPHPFWIPVLLLSVQYGSVSGLLATAAAIGLSWLAGWPVQSPEEDFYAYFLRVWREPVLWTLCAVVVGGLRNRQINEGAVLEEKLRTTAQQRDTIAHFAQELRSHVATCERAVATARPGTLNEALASLHALAMSDLETAPSALLSAVRLWLGDGQVAVYAAEGWVPGTRWRTARARLATVANGQLGELAPAFRRALERPAASLTVFSAADARVLDGIGLFAAPIRASEGVLLGAVVVRTVAVPALKPELAEATLALAYALERFAVDKEVSTGRSEARGLDRQLATVVPLRRVDDATSKEHDYA